MKVRCIDSSDSFLLSYNKIYDVIEEYEKAYNIKLPSGDWLFYAKTRFEPVEEEKENKTMTKCDECVGCECEEVSGKIACPAFISKNKGENKIMKGCEAIKYLCENIEGKLKTKALGMEYKISVEDGLIRIRDKQENSYLFRVELMQADWQVVEQSVTLNEALLALDDNKTIRHEFSSKIHDKQRPEIIKRYNKQKGQHIAIERLLHGKWYIEG